MTQADIEKLNFLAPSSLLQTFMSVAVITQQLFSRRMLPAKKCLLQFFVDGVAIPTPRILDAELPSPKEIGGIEVYASPATIPLQYKRFDGGGYCGVVLIWTRDTAG